MWVDAHGKGLYDTGITLAPSQVESLIGTVAAGVGTVLDAEHPIVEAEVQMAGIRCRFEGFGPPVVMRPCLAIRKPAQVLYTLEDYVRDGIVTPAYAELFRAAISDRQNILLAGATGSGKTTLGGALINAMVARRRSQRALRDHRGHAGNPVPRGQSGAAADQCAHRYDAAGARDDAAAAGPHHHRRSARRRSARACSRPGTPVIRAA